MSPRGGRAAVTGLGMILLASSAAHAARPGQRDPDWPCQQIKVPELSLAAIWSGPAIDPRQTGWKDDPEIVDLVHQLAPRRESLSQAQALIHDFAQRTGDRKQTKLLALLAGLFSVLGDERDSVMSGLDRFGGRQKELAVDIRADNEKLHAMQSDSASDPKAVQQMVQKVTWSVTVFQDRRQALRYACDVPGKIEQRLFALARQIQQELH